MAVDVLTSAQSERVGPRRGFRPDVQGLRGLAVLLVVLYHAEVTFFSGGFVGVDVFFVISGFLITSGPVRELRDQGTISWSAFYARRARRILPAATVLLFGVALLTVLFLPVTRRDSIGWDVIASALYFENWRLDSVSTDYLQANVAASPLQHFWSLAVEEQFYIVWPLLLLGVAGMLRRMAARHGSNRMEMRERWLTPLLLTVVALVAVPSFTVSVFMTANSPEGAYFVTQTRLWELALGAALAIAAPLISAVPRVLSNAVGWAGLAAIVWAALAYSDRTPFPGYHALVPTLGAVLVIGAGLSSTGRSSPTALLRIPPARFLGDLSYSYYLWHWPLIVAVQARVSPEQFDFRLGLCTVTAALVPAWLSYRYVERPFQRHDDAAPSSTLQSAAIAMLVAVMAGNLLIWTVWPTAPVSNGLRVSVPITDEDGEVVKVGAMVLAKDPRDDTTGQPRDQVSSIYPSPGSSGVAGCPTLTADVDVSPCTYGDVDSETVIALLGDSHAAQWASGLIGAAATRGWLVTEFTKQSCPTADVPVLDDKGNVNDRCDEWLSEVIPEIIERAPDVVVVSGVDRATSDAGGKPFEDDAGSDQAQAIGYVRVWKEFVDAGIDVIALRDTPRPNFDVPECVSRNLDSLSECTFDREEGNAGGRSLILAAEQSGAPLVDLNDAVCPTSRCAPVIGGYLVYNDDNHMTSTYASTLADRLGRSLRKASDALR